MRRRAGCPLHPPSRADAKEWVRGGARFQCRRAGQRRNENAAGFCLPPRIDNRAALIADDLVIPEPSFWIDRLANGP